jgi:two-component system response regulator
MSTNQNALVLLVDDNPADIELTVHVLRRNRLTNSIQIVEDGEQALDFIFCRGRYQDRQITDRPSVILLDLKLPKVDGIEVLKAIRADDRTKAIPIVILTSSKEQRDLVNGYRSGVSAFIQKPVDFTEFQTAIKEVGLFWLVVNQPPPPEAFD